MTRQFQAMLRHRAFIALPAIAAILSCAASLRLFWPGYAGFDAIDQYLQAASGHYVDWHPPIMARLWSLLLMFGGVVAPMFALQMLLYWIGLGLLATALARSGRPLAGLAIVAIGAFPEFLGWQAEVLKDTQMNGALLAAVGLMATWQLAGRPLPILVQAMIALLLVYATLLRGNAAFVTVPLAMMQLAQPITKTKLVLGIVGIFAVVGLTPLVNQKLLGAEPSTFARTQPIYDLAGILAHGGSGVGLTEPERKAVLELKCYKPFFWDPLGNPQRCGPALARLSSEPIARLYYDWIAAIRHDPLAYARHRIAHLNATERLVVPMHWLRGAPTTTSWQPGRLSETAADDIPIAEPGALAKRFQLRVGRLADTPICWPIAWVVLALTCMFVLRRATPSAVRTLAFSLLISALALEASFAVLSIASPLRYHLWPMIATALALVLTISERVRAWRVWLMGGIAMAVVIAVGMHARLTLPPASTTYTGNL